MENSVKAAQAEAAATFDNAVAALDKALKGKTTSQIAAKAEAKAIEAFRKAEAKEAPTRAPGKAKRASKSSGKATKAPKAKASPAPAKGNGKGTKNELIGNMLKRKNGTTRPEVLAATGWPSISMQAYAKTLGLKLKVAKVPGEPTRYFGS